MIAIRFEHLRTDEIFEAGEYEVAQLTYNLLRAGPDGNVIATQVPGGWQIAWELRPARPTAELRKLWSDVIISAVERG